MKYLYVLLLCALALPSWARDWKVDTGKSQIRFVVKQMNVPVEGGFKRFTGQFAFDPARPESGRFRVEVDMLSADTGSDEGDDEAKRPAWFDSARHPRAVFESKSLRKDAEGRYTAQGDLTVKGRTRAIAVPVTLFRQANGGWVADGRFPLRRTDFGIGGGEWADPSVVGIDVDVRFRMTLLP